jgi:hypothetical protein
MKAYTTTIIFYWFVLYKVTLHTLGGGGIGTQWLSSAFNVKAQSWKDPSTQLEGTRRCFMSSTLFTSAMLVLVVLNLAGVPLVPVPVPVPALPVSALEVDAQHHRPVCRISIILGGYAPAVTAEW